MKKYLLLVASVVMLAACSTPKYAYYFDHYDYNSGKTKAETKAIIAQSMLASPETSPLYLNQDAVTTSAERRLTQVEKIPIAVTKISAADKEALRKKYSAMTKAEKKEFRKDVKEVVKQVIKAKKSGESIDSIEEVKVMDHNLKMALIFGIVGILLSALGGVNSIFWILGTIAAVIAIVFLVMWIAEQ